MQNKLEKIYARFKAAGTFHSGDPVGSGHIHETFLIRTLEEDSNDYILQRLNNQVFKNIPEMQENIERVTEHIRAKLSQNPASDLRRECPELVKSLEGKNWITDASGSFWRMFVFIPDNVTYDLVDSPAKAFEGGKAIGKFQKMVSDLPGKALYETIPGFHDIERRLFRFEEVVKADTAGRVKDCFAEISFMRQRADRMTVIHRLGREGMIPVRIVHNDTKFNNILFDKNGKSLCLIDLDTVMPGYYHSDFGDAIRTGANKATEDEPALEKISMDLSLFRAYAEGYLSETSDMLNQTEKEHLALTPVIITFEQALRFLADYLEGDIYYRIHHPEHNLQRTRAQMRLVESMEEQLSQMQKIIREI